MPSRSTSLAKANPRPQKAAALPLLPALPGDDSVDDEGSDKEESKQQKSQQKTLKRKSPAGEDASSTKGSRQQKAAKTTPGARNASHEQQKADKRRQETELVSEDIGRMDGQLLADHFARQVRRFESELSEAETERRRVAPSRFKDTSDFDQKRTLESLPAFLERYSGRSRDQLRQAAVRNGAPHTLVVSASGIRAADVTRALRIFQTKDALVAKLFAKHIKLKEALETSRTSRMHIGVGTPQRIFDLIDQGAVTCEELERIVVDASALNQKQRGILDMAESERPLSRLLALAAVAQVPLLVF